MVRRGQKRFGHRTRRVSIVVALLSVTGCSSDARHGAETSVSTSASASVSAASVTTTGSADLGTLTVTLGALDGQTVSQETLDAATATLRNRLAYRDDPVIAVKDKTIVVSLPHASADTSTDVVWPEADSAVYLRPVQYCYTATPDATATSADTVSDPTQSEPLPTRDGQVCLVGPSRGDATVFEAGSADAEEIGGGWGITVALKDGASGEGVWNALAGECYEGSSVCPSHQLAIEIYGIVQSAPTVNAPTFEGTVQITGRFTKDEAADLAGTINAGAAPTQLVVLDSTFTPDD